MVGNQKMIIKPKLGTVVKVVAHDMISPFESPLGMDMEACNLDSQAMVGLVNNFSKFDNTSNCDIGSIECRIKGL